MFAWRGMRKKTRFRLVRGASFHWTNFRSLDECIGYDEKYIEGDRGFLVKKLNT